LPPPAPVDCVDLSGRGHKRWRLLRSRGSEASFAGERGVDHGGSRHRSGAIDGSMAGDRGVDRGGSRDRWRGIEGSITGDRGIDHRGSECRSRGLEASTGGDRWIDGGRSGHRSEGNEASIAGIEGIRRGRCSRRPTHRLTRCIARRESRPPRRNGRSWYRHRGPPPFRRRTAPAGTRDDPRCGPRQPAGRRRRAGPRR
jgi:hypothetical protein